METNEKANIFAANTLPIILDLKGNKGYTAYLVPMIEKRISDLEKSILNDDLSSKELKELKFRREELKNIFAQIDKDILNHQKTLNQR